VSDEWTTGGWKLLPVIGCPVCTFYRELAHHAEAERNRIQRLYDAKTPIHERRRLPFPFWDERDDPLTQSHWPECTCVECYALHHLGVERSRAKSTDAEHNALLKLVASQANDEGLWFEAKTAPEAYLQRALRFLHATIEKDVDALEALIAEQEKSG
jgi:hypothetical protein